MFIDRYAQACDVLVWGSGEAWVCDGDSGSEHALFDRGPSCGGCYEVMCVEDLKYCLADISIVVTAPTRASPPTPATSAIHPTTMSSSPFKPSRKLRSGRPASCRSSTAGTQSYLRTMQLLSLSDYIEVEELGCLYDVFNKLSAYDVIGAQNYRRPLIRLNRIVPEVHKQFDILTVPQLFPEGHRGLDRENDAFPANIDSMACNMSGYQ